jgi:hypothetical protein
MTALLATAAAVLVRAPGAGHLSFAIYRVALERRSVFVAITKEIDPVLNPLGIYSMTVGGKLSTVDAFEACAKAVAEHSAWFRRVHGADASPLYAMPETISTADFRAEYLR